MSEIESKHWLRPVHKGSDAHALSLPVETAFCTISYQLTTLRTAWHDTRSHLYSGVESLFDGPDLADEAIKLQRKMGTYFKVSAKIGIKVLAGDDYLILTHINTSQPFKGWSEPSVWGRLNRPPTLGEIHAAFQPSKQGRTSSGWPEGMQEPDLLIGIGKSRFGHSNWLMPLDMEMNNYSSKGVRPGYADEGFEYLKAADTTIVNTQDLRLAVLSLNETINKQK